LPEITSDNDAGDRRQQNRLAESQLFPNQKREMALASD
jgi:hypothetical protein